MATLPNKEFRQIVPLLREKDFYEPKPLREISWPEYSFSQIEEASRIMDFISEEVDTTEYMVRKGKRGRTCI